MARCRGHRPRAGSAAGAPGRADRDHRGGVTMLAAPRQPPGHGNAAGIPGVNRRFAPQGFQDLADLVVSNIGQRPGCTELLGGLVDGSGSLLDTVSAPIAFLTPRQNASTRYTHTRLRERWSGRATITVTSPPVPVWVLGLTGQTVRLECQPFVPFRAYPALDNIGPPWQLGVLRGDQSDQRGDLGWRHAQRPGDFFGGSGVQVIGGAHLVTWAFSPELRVPRSFFLPPFRPLAGHRHPHRHRILTSATSRRISRV